MCPEKTWKKLFWQGLRKELYFFKDNVNHANLWVRLCLHKCKILMSCTALSMSRQTSPDCLHKLMFHCSPSLKLGSVTTLLKHLFLWFILWRFGGMVSGWLLTIVFPLSDWVNSWWQACSFHELAVSHVDEQTNKNPQQIRNENLWANSPSLWYCLS